MLYRLNYVGFDHQRQLVDVEAPLGAFSMQQRLPCDFPLDGALNPETQTGVVVQLTPRVEDVTLPEFATNYAGRLVTYVKVEKVS